jgi:hypothetical protein
MPPVCQDPRQHCSAACRLENHPYHKDQHQHRPYGNQSSLGTHPYHKDQHQSGPHGNQSNLGTHPYHEDQRQHGPHGNQSNLGTHLYHQDWHPYPSHNGPQWFPHQNHHQCGQDLPLFASLAGPCRIPQHGSSFNQMVHLDDRNPSSRSFQVAVGHHVAGTDFLGLGPSFEPRFLAPIDKNQPRIITNNSVATIAVTTPATKGNM